MTGVSPQINLSNTLSAQRGDSLDTAFQKFNTHVHSTAKAASFLAEPIKVGDVISLRDINGEEVYRPNFTSLPVTVTQVTNDYLVLSQFARATVEDGVATYGSNGRALPFVRSVQGSNRLYRTEIPDGFISAQELDRLVKTSYTGTLNLPQVPESEDEPFGVSAVIGVSIVDGNYRFISNLEIDPQADNPVLQLYRGVTYRFRLSSYAQLSGFYLTTNLTSVGDPPATRYESGVRYFSAGGLITDVIFTVPYDAPEILVYQSLGGAISGQIQILSSDITQSRDYFAQIQSLTGGFLSEPLPVLNPPIILSAVDQYRLTQLHVLPVWNTELAAGAASVRLSYQTPLGTTYITPYINLSQVGRLTYTLAETPLINPGEAVHLSVFTRNQLIALHYQLDVVRVI